MATASNIPDDDALDRAILSDCRVRRHKVAMVISRASDALGIDFSSVPDAKWTERIKALIASGRLEGFGDVSNWRFSEVQLAEAEIDRAPTSATKPLVD